MELTVGQILSGTLDVIRARFWSLAGLWLTFAVLAIVSVFVFALVIGVGSMAGMSQGNADFINTLGASVIVMAIAFYVVYFLIVLSQMGALIAKASPLQDLSFGEALSAGVRSSPTMLLVMILLLILYFAFALVAAIPAMLLAFAGTVGVIITVLLLVPLVAFLACRLSLLFPVAAVEGQRNPLTVIGRSWKLTGGKVLPIFLSLLVLTLAVIALAVLLFVPIWGTLNDAANPPGGGVLAYMFVAFFAFGILVAMIQAAVVSVIHAAVSGSTGVDIADTFG